MRRSSTPVEARGINCVVAPIADGVIFGLETHSYILGLEVMSHLLRQPRTGQ
jgi:3-dehydroquinate dehydratase